MAQKHVKRKLRFTIPKRSQEEIENIPLKNLVYLSLFLNVSTIVFVLLIRNNLPPVVPLYYGLAKSESQLGKQIQLLIPNTVAFIIVAVNILITMFFDNDFLEKTLIVAAFAASILSTITVIKIIFLVGSF